MFFVPKVVPIREKFPATSFQRNCSSAELHLWQKHSFRCLSHTVFFRRQVYRLVSSRFTPSCSPSLVSLFLPESEDNWVRVVARGERVLQLGERRRSGRFERTWNELGTGSEEECTRDERKSEERRETEIRGSFACATPRVPVVDR